MIKSYLKQIQKLKRAPAQIQIQRNIPSLNTRNLKDKGIQLQKHVKDVTVGGNHVSVKHITSKLAIDKL